MFNFVMMNFPISSRPLPAQKLTIETLEQGLKYFQS